MDIQHRKANTNDKCSLLQQYNNTIVVFTSCIKFSNDYSKLRYFLIASSIILTQTESEHSSEKCRRIQIDNKSFSYQDTPPLHSLLVCILNFDNKTSKNFSKCNHLFGRYLGETHFVHKSRAVTRLKNKEKQNVIG